MDDFRRSLDALRAGDLSGWQPLPLDLSADDVRTAAPDGTDGPAGEWLLGQPASTWRLPATDATPHGVVVWIQGGLATLVDVRDPEFAASPEAVLGPPEAVLPSGLGPAQEQRLWSTRGLLLHVDRITGRITRLFGHEAADAEAIADSPLARMQRDRRREVE